MDIPGVLFGVPLVELRKKKWSLTCDEQYPPGSVSQGTSRRLLLATGMRQFSIQIWPDTPLRQVDSQSVSQSEGAKGQILPAKMEGRGGGLGFGSPSQENFPHVHAQPFFTEVRHESPSRKQVLFLIHSLG